MGLQDLTGKEHQIEFAYKVSGRKCLRDTRTGLQGLIGSHQQIQPAYKVTGRGRRIEGSHGLGTTDRTCPLGIRRWLQDLTGSKHEIERAYEVSARCCIISRARNTRSYMLTRYPDGAARYHWFVKPDCTCLRGIKTGLQYLTGLEQ